MFTFVISSIKITCMIGCQCQMDAVQIIFARPYRRNSRPAKQVDGEKKKRHRSILFRNRKTWYRSVKEMSNYEQYLNSCMCDQHDSLFPSARKRTYQDHNRKCHELREISKTFYSELQNRTAEKAQCAETRSTPTVSRYYELSKGQTKCLSGLIYFKYARVYSFCMVDLE